MNKLEIAAQILASMTGSEKYQLAVTNLKVRENGVLVPADEARKSIEGILEKHAHLALFQADALLRATKDQDSYKNAAEAKAKLTGNYNPGSSGPNGWMGT